MELSVSLPLDEDRFLRRECPHCERQFKWLPSDESAEAAEGGYFCPYCREQAGAGEWWTPAQLEAVKAKVMSEVVDPELDKLGNAVRGIERASGGPVSARLERGPRRARRELAEPNDMRRIDFPCHPGEPVKVTDDWVGGVHCLLCGAATIL